MSAARRPTILHYVGYDDDRGGIVSVVRALAATGSFDCVLGVNPGCTQRRTPPLPVLALPALAGEAIGPVNAWGARAVAVAVAAWLRADARRVFHGHSRAGLLVALWLDWLGERRVVVSVHCYGRHRWFYRWAARRLAGRLFWLSPAMKVHYGADDPGSWTQCVPGCAPVPGRPGLRQTPGATVRLAGIGALVSWKNWHLLPAALALLPEPVRRRVHFAHIGAGDGTAESARYEAGLREQSARPELSGLIEWRGEQSGPAGLLAETDCLLVLSASEPFSVAMLEALAAGVPVLAADGGGARDVIRPDVNGWLFQADDPQALAGALARLVETKALRQVDPAATDLARFKPAVVAAQWAEIYLGVGCHE